MKWNHVSIIAASFILAVQAGAHSADENGECKEKHKKWKKHHEEMLAKYDTNKDGKLDDAEKAAMKADLKARHDEFVKKYDKNGDGKLDKEERAAAKEDRKKNHEKCQD